MYDEGRLRDLQAIGRSMIGGTDAAIGDDAVQEALIHAMQRPETTDAHFRQMVRWRIVDEVRRRDAKTNGLGQEPSAADLARLGGLSPEQVVEGREGVRALALMAQALPPKSQRAVRALFEAGGSVKDAIALIAIETGESPKRVRQQLDRAREVLRKQWNEVLTKETENA